MQENDKQTRAGFRKYGQFFYLGDIIKKMAAASIFTELASHMYRNVFSKSG